MKKFLKQFAGTIMGVAVLGTVFAAVVPRIGSQLEIYQNRITFTSGGLSTGAKVMDINSGGVIIAYGSLTDGSGNTFLTGGYFNANSGTYFQTNSGTYFNTNSGIFFNTNSGVYFNTNSGAYFIAHSGAYFQANSGTYFNTNSGAYYTSNPLGFITGSALTPYVLLSGTQTITGLNTFVTAIKIGNGAGDCTGTIIGSMTFSGDNFYGCRAASGWVQLDN